jgi:hypothetical protein
MLTKCKVSNRASQVTCKDPLGVLPPPHSAVQLSVLTLLPVPVPVCAGAREQLLAPEGSRRLFVPLDRTIARIRNQSQEAESRIEIYGYFCSY